MATLEERIAQFQKMAHDDPENELGHYSLGRVLMEAGRFAEAAPAFERALALNPYFTKAYQLLGECYLQLQRADKAAEIFREGYSVAEERHDAALRDELARALRSLGQEPPAPRAVAGATAAGFVCRRPGCHAGPEAQQLPNPPMNDELGQLVYQSICTACWREWLAMGVKVINELRLDLSDERHQQVYENYMKEFLGLA
ncbi:MAG: hypothetical protein C4297_12530 [Gemmataceae bacterium]